MKKKIKYLIIVIIIIFLVLISLFVYFESKKESVTVSINNIEYINEIDEDEEEKKDEKESVIIVFLDQKKYNKTKDDSFKKKTANIVKAIKNKKKAIAHNQETQTDNETSNTQQNLVVEDEITINPDTYYIKVNYTANVVNIYNVYTDGKIADCIKAFVCSTGTSTPTSGVYKIDYKYRWLALFGNVYGQYATRIVGNILFHSVPYIENENNASLEYWEYDKLGTSASAGCVRLTVEDAKWIYDNCKSGTSVEFYSDEDPGPLRKTRNNKDFRI